MTETFIGIFWIKLLFFQFQICHNGQTPTTQCFGSQSWKMMEIWKLEDIKIAPLFEFDNFFLEDSEMMFILSKSLSYFSRSNNCVLALILTIFLTGEYSRLDYHYDQLL